MAVVDENDGDLAAVIGVDRAGRIEHGNAVADSKSRRWAYLPFCPGRQCERDPGWDCRLGAGRQNNRSVGRNGCVEVETGREGALIGGQRQVGAVRQACNPQVQDHRAAAMRSTSICATSSFDCSGQASTPRAVMRCTLLRSPPMTPDCADTSLARIQSLPLDLSLALACSTTRSVSAAKPMTSLGRLDLSFATVARMSGFSISMRCGAPPAAFLI